MPPYNLLNSLEPATNSAHRSICTNSQPRTSSSWLILATVALSATDNNSAQCSVSNSKDCSKQVHSLLAPSASNSIIIPAIKPAHCLLIWQQLHHHSSNQVGYLLAPSGSNYIIISAIKSAICLLLVAATPSSFQSSSRTFACLFW
jgi:hypothetical protein